MKTCYHCGNSFADDFKPGFREECPKCLRDVHVCYNCVFWDKTFSNECRETQAERVREKDKNNFCEYFSFKEGKSNGLNKSPDNPRDAFNKLFND